jgi:hypothetical protein
MINSPGPSNNTDDLDLWSMLAKTITFFRKYGKMILATTLTGMLAGIAIYISLPKLYSSKLTLESTLLSNLEEIQIIENWNSLLNRSGYSTLAETLNCDPLVVEKIGHISAEQIQKGTNNDNTSGFIVEVLIKDTILLEIIQRGIVYGLENGDYVKDRIATRRSHLEELIQNVKNERVKLDSVKKNVEDILRNKQKNGSSLMIDVSGISSQIIGLQEKQLGYEETLKFADAVRVLQKFVKFKRPVEPKLSKLLLLGFIGGFGLGYIAALLRVIRSKYREYAKTIS